MDTSSSLKYKGRARGLLVKKVNAGATTTQVVSQSTRIQALRKLRDDMRTLREVIIDDAEGRQTDNTWNTTSETWGITIRTKE